MWCWAAFQANVVVGSAGPGLLSRSICNGILLRCPGTATSEARRFRGEHSAGSRSARRHEVKEWIEHHDDWAALGTFQIESGDYQGRAEGNLIPESFYAAQVQRRRHIKIPRAKAETFLGGWEIGQEYDGYIYPDAQDRIFFELPGAETNARMVKRLGITSAIFFTLGLSLQGTFPTSGDKNGQSR
jgi:hypothetical protein